MTVPAADDARDADAHGLSWTLLTLARLATERTRDEMPVGAVLVLYHLRRSGSMRITELATLVGLDISTISRRVGALEEEGLVERVGDPADARAALIGLTPAGADRLALFSARRQAALDELVAAWSPEDLATFSRLAALLRDSLDETLRGERRTR
ncbi:transcriptional regulator, MarR family [Beutenbergia cavernae DSM 12333]|uniref:Transcriptional regulator, MarR family n=1 Tax=Beutenbergia cavernae (strain ATCC BAA-8 / DSM 12333 / CCUG 43141 / JCM 11478 / NBRC 16432 / NCIMB 13614 / HKI 0122) TaxID=471853 RepID=C5BZ65_BEUC1|nr:MarR family transcriptional regulator [Beutenbergia cavernae]ACQ81180.1 transcriptional regulator, MarR family [Beutenbergia cavernae DSM 12333]